MEGTYSTGRGPGLGSTGVLLSAEGRGRAQGLAMGGSGLLHAYVLEKRHMMQQFAVEATEIKQTHI